MSSACAYLLFDHPCPLIDLLIGFWLTKAYKHGLLTCFCFWLHVLAYWPAYCFLTAHAFDFMYTNLNLNPADHFKLNGFKSHSRIWTQAVTDSSLSILEKSDAWWKCLKCLIHLGHISGLAENGGFRQSGLVRCHGLQPFESTPMT